MKVEFNETEKRLSISECEFENVEIHKDGQAIADIPLTNGEGFIVNTDLIKLDDTLTLYPYNSIQITVENSVEV